MEAVEIVRALPDDAAELSEIARAAKAHWGYPESWLEAWRENLTITPAFIDESETYKAVPDGRTLGFYGLQNSGDSWRLEHLWVRPKEIGRGIGRALFQHATARGCDARARSLTIECDPHAEGFYLRLGAVRIGSRVSELDGERRELPLLRCDLTSLTT